MTDRLDQIDRDISEVWELDLPIRRLNARELLRDLSWAAEHLRVGRVLVGELTAELAELRQQHENSLTPEPTVDLSKPRIWKGDMVEEAHWHWACSSWTHYTGALRTGDIFVRAGKLPGDFPQPTEPPWNDLEACVKVDW